MTTNSGRNLWVYGLLVLTCVMLGLSCILFWQSLLVPVFIGLSPIILYYGLTHPYFFCLIFCVFSVFRLHEVIPVLFPYKIPLVSAILGILSLSINVLLNKTTLYWQKEMRYFLIFFVFITLGVPLSYNFQVAYAYWSQLFIKIGIIFFMITWSVDDKTSFRLFIFLSITCGVLLSLMTLYDKAHSIHLIEGSRAVVQAVKESVIGDPNDLALVLLFPFSFCCSLFVTKVSSMALRLSGLFSAFFIIDAIVATQSRGGLLGLAGVISYFLTHRIKSKLLLVLIGFCLIPFLFFVAHISSRQSGGAAVQGLDESSLGRLHAWEAAVNMAIHHPIWGVGLYGFKDSLFTYAVVWDKRTMAVHSSWFGVLAESGFVGLALFIILIYQAMKLAHRNINLIESFDRGHAHMFNTELILARGLYAGLIGFCISSTFLTQGFSWPLYIFFALTISLTHSIETRQNMKGIPDL